MNSSSPAGSIHIHNDCNKQTRANNGSIWAHIITTINAFITGESVSVLAECPHCTPNSPFTQPHVLRSRTVKRSYSLCHFFLARAHKCTANGKKTSHFIELICARKLSEPALTSTFFQVSVRSGLEGGDGEREWGGNTSATQSPPYKRANLNIYNRKRNLSFMSTVTWQRIDFIWSSCTTTTIKIPLWRMHPLLKLNMSK